MSARVLPRDTVEKLRAADRVLRQAERLREQAEQEAQKAHHDLMEQARLRALKESAQTAARVLAEAEATADRQLKALEPTIARLVSETVERIIGAADRAEMVERATQTALTRLRDHRRGRVTAAPDVADAVRQAVARMPAGAGAEVVEVVVDERLQPGRTILSSDRGHVEIGLADQVAAATEAFRPQGDEDGADD